MQPLKAHVHNGRLVLDEPTELPDGQVVALVRADDVEPMPGKSAADVLRELGPWEGETYEELVTLFADVRQPSSRDVPAIDP